MEYQVVLHILMLRGVGEQMEARLLQIQMEILQQQFKQIKLQALVYLLTQAMVEVVQQLWVMVYLKLLISGF